MQRRSGLPLGEQIVLVLFGKRVRRPFQAKHPAVLQLLATLPGPRRGIHVLAPSTGVLKIIDANQHILRVPDGEGIFRGKVIHRFHGIVGLLALGQCLSARALSQRICRFALWAVLEYLPTMRTAIYPGSFDPLTNGHLDIVQRAAKLFDRVIVAVARSETKRPLFTLKERLSLVRQSLAGYPNVEADTFDCLLVDYVDKREGQVIIRGLRAVSDFEFEFQLALMNRKLNAKVETIFMMPKETYTFLSSRIVKEIASLGGNVACFVPTHVGTALARKFGRLNGLS
jgi:pantetheine-phosphate adenylyltransferase